METMVQCHGTTPHSRWNAQGEAVEGVEPHRALVLTVFANHVAGQPSMERVLGFPVVGHRGKRSSCPAAYLLLGYFWLLQGMHIKEMGHTGLPVPFVLQGRGQDMEELVGILLLKGGDLPPVHPQHIQQAAGIQDIILCHLLAG